MIEESRQMQARDRPVKPYLKREKIMSVISEDRDLESRASTVNEPRPVSMVESDPDQFESIDEESQ